MDVDAAACPECGGPAVAITLKVDDRLVMMRSCNPCDRRWWSVDGELVEVGDVLGVTGSRSRSRSA